MRQIARRTMTGVGVALALLLGGAAGPSGRWIGQDGHDLVGKAATAGPSQVQDIHFLVDGLPSRAKVVSGAVRAEGGGEWKVGEAPGSWLALVEKPAGATSADVYVEPYQVETGRWFEIQLQFDDGRSTSVRVRGGKADPNLRVASARVKARWEGQTKRDVVGPTPNAGPDGINDAHIGLAGLAAKDEVRSILISGPEGMRWQFGPNPEAFPRAEFVRQADEPTLGQLYFQPSREPSGVSLKLTLTYASGQTDSTTVTAGHCDPTLKVAQPTLPVLAPIGLKATWLGQGRPGSVRAGEVAVALEGLPTGRIVGVDLSDGDVGGWSSRERGDDPDPLPLTLRRGSDSTRAELAFPPVRDESGATMTLRISFADGRSAVGSFPGGPCDPALRSEGPVSSSVTARPGDDLNELANRYGTVTLGAGVYSLRRPLVLTRPVAITSAAGAEVVFTQEAGQPAWKAAIEIRAGQTTLDGFAIRFTGPVRWDRDVAYGPAVIGTIGNDLAGLRFTRLKIEAPPASSAWEEAPRTLRLTGATSGVIERNRIKGGMVEFWGGPWRVTDNVFDGTPAGAFAHAMLAVHEPHDLAIERNKARPLDPRGKSWRWLVMTNRGSNVRVAENAVEGVGPRDNDTHEHPNAPETILTESYRLHFEGKTLGSSPDGRILTIPSPQQGPIRVGDVLAVLSGPEAGTWRRIVLPLGGNAYLLDRPVAVKGGAVAIGPGFVATTFEWNTIDDRGSKVAFPIVLAGQHFGTKLANNAMRGGSASARLVATGTESPGPWGWSHTAMFGLAIEGNTFEDAWDGMTLGVEHNALTRPSRGRVYATATLSNNHFVATPPFLSRRGVKPPFLTIGEPASGDPGELVVTESGNHARGVAAGAGRALKATVNGRAVPDGRIELTPEPTQRR